MNVGKEILRPGIRPLLQGRLFRKRGALFSPLQFAPAVWLDAADSSTLFDATSGGSVVISGGTVARWEDKSGNSRHLVQATLGQRPVLNVTSAFRNVAFDGTDDNLRIVYALARPQTVFMVAAARTTAVNDCLFHSAASGNSSQIRQRSATLYQVGRASAAGPFVTMVQNQRHVLTNRVLTDSYNIRLDDGAEQTEALTTAASTEITLAGQSGATNNADCRIFEFLAYPSGLNETEQAKVRAYLKAKWST